MDDIMLCPSCGKELPKESSFCPYCMTKFTPEIPMDNQPKKSKKPIYIIAAVVLLIAVAAIVALLFLPDKDKASSQNTATEVAVTSRVNTTDSSSDDTLPPAQAQLHDTAAGLVSGGFFTAEHSSLIASESVYKDARIKFECIVLKVDGDIAFVEYGATKGFDGIYNSTSDYAAVKMGNVSPGESLTVYGIFIGIEDYTVGGKSENLPTFDVQSYTEFVGYSVPSPVLSSADISASARQLFGDGVTVRASVRSDFADSAVADILTDGGMFYTAVTDYGSYCFYAGENNFILDCTSTMQTEKYILPATQSGNIYTYTFDNANDKFVLACLDKSFNTVWTREFKNSADAVFDYTSDYFYIVADSNLYVLSAATGENAVSPKYVGARCGILKVKDGLILVSDKNTDTVCKTDLNGNVVRSVSLSGDISDSQVTVQAVPSGYLVGFESEYGEYYTALVTDDGKVAFEYSAN